MIFVSYAQNFEDVMLYRALKHIRHGFYVDVGAQHPLVDSVTKAFSIAGWRGINIEPVKHWYDMLEKDRPHDINLNVAVGGSGSLQLFEVEGTGLSTTDSVLAERYRHEGRAVVERSVPAVTLDDIFDTQHVDLVHFLKVDCEGAEELALASCSFERVRPWIVLVEATEPNSQVSTYEKWGYLLTGKDYFRAYDDGLNLYFVAKEHEELLAAFSKPPNVFDDFIRARDKEAHEEHQAAHLRAHNLAGELSKSHVTVTELARSLDAANQQHAEWRVRNAAELAAITAERDVLAESVGELQRLVAHLRARVDDAQRQMKVDENARLLQHQHELHEQLAQLQVEVARREAAIQNLTSSTSWRLTAPMRGIKLLARRGARGAWRIGRPSVARAARAARPLVRGVLKVPGIRAMARSLLGPQTRIGRRARVFLFPLPADGSLPVAPIAMTERAQAMKELLQVAIDKRLRD